jgi:high-affinity nickel-transport protein
MATVLVNDGTDLLEGNVDQSRRSWFKAVSVKATDTHARVPGLKKLPFPAFAIIVFLIFVNIAVWVAAGIVLVCFFILKVDRSNDCLTRRSIIIRMCLQSILQ